MIKLGLKLWTNNTEMFREAAALYNERKIDFVELYYNVEKQIDTSSLEKLKIMQVNLHCPHTQGFDNFRIGNREMKLWSKIIKLAFFFKSQYIIVHPGLNHTYQTFEANFEKIKDERILIENMPAFDVDSSHMFAMNLADLEQIKKVSDICFDIEKAVKSSFYQKIDYKRFINKCLNKLGPKYFHLSGGNKNSSVDEHQNLWDANFDVNWVKKTLENYSHGNEVSLVFETPKNDINLDNDIDNIKYFANL